MLVLAVLTAQMIALDHTILLRLPFFHFIMHVAGGMAVALAAMAFIANFKLPMPHARYVVVMVVLIFGLLWELFETIFNLTGYRLGSALYYLDLGKDLADDLLGGIFIVWLMN